MADYPCPCCGHLVFEDGPGSHSVCGVCFWEDDAVQLRWPDWRGGANGPSLIEAQRSYAELGAMEPRFTRSVRPAAAAEPIDDGWRPIDLAVDDFEPRGVHDEPWPADRTALYWWRPHFRRRR
ncbi:CPCC family cysteine-rich protein [Amycolatopsis rhabdoformis]|uniref:CPCC family cysteine-rich protein n=1 Tax=Amycolatopsis rhabdoformis TaxID=1448059 RepID=A0ABZ1IM90_9PSEU|nr:CPCC family cysteine-rich protein [Amycolatopsis rhabdoformis]WSE34793.1 CPCC family cysteine-rich protein [Amycolatopsis rhabdoformis]